MPLHRDQQHVGKTMSYDAGPYDLSTSRAAVCPEFAVVFIASFLYSQFLTPALHITSNFM